MARLLSLAAALALLVTLALAVPPIERDVCILGSGASGTYSLVQLSTRNYSVQLFETDDEVGGYCDTVYFNAPPGAPNWLELGVNTFENPNVTNSLGLTNYKVDFKGFVESLGVPTQSIDYIGSTTATTGNYAFWLAGRLNLQIPPQTPDQIQATFAALITLQTIIATYPWLDTPNWPNPLPAELLGNFLDYIKDPAHNLEILVPSLFGPLLYSGGLGDFSRLTTIYALRNLHKSILALFTVPNSGFVCIGGCKAYYNAARARYSDRIMLNAVITDVDRPRGCPPGVAVDDDDDCHDDDNRIRITVKTGSRGQRQQYRCGKLLVAFTPYLPDIQFLGPDSVERALWQDLKVRYYWGFQVNITGPISNNGAFQISIVDPTQPQNYALPSLPGITGISRFLPYGPAAGLAVSNEPLSDDAITAVIKQQLALFPPDQVTSAVFQKLEPHTRFQPHFSPSVLAQSPSPYARLASLQGYKNTFWLGQVASYSETLMVTEHANQIINQYFPAKPRPGRS